jgi:hypothetical protein
MVKFIHKKHVQHTAHGNALVIYYSLSEIILGILLIGLVTFYIVAYLKSSLQGSTVHSSAVAAMSNFPPAIQHR